MNNCSNTSGIRKSKKFVMSAVSSPAASAAATTSRTTSHEMMSSNIPSLMSPSFSNSNFGRYFSRSNRWSLRLKRTEEYMYTDEQNFVGWYSPLYFLNWCIFLVVPLAYIYIGLVVLRELCRTFPETIYKPIQYYTPAIGRLLHEVMNYVVLRYIEIWCYIEALFYILLKLRIKYLNSCDPLETSLAAAPLMDEEQRDLLWDRMMSVECRHPISFISGWFFDEPIENISKYDVRDFLAWSMFEGRHQEHLTVSELRQLEKFVNHLEELITAELYGDSHQEGENAETKSQQFDNHENQNGTQQRHNPGQGIEETEYEDTNESDGNTDECGGSCSPIVQLQEPSNNLTSMDDHDQDHDQNKPEGDLHTVSSSPATFVEDLPTLSATKRNQEFRFRQEIQHEEPSFFSDLFETYRTAFMQNMALAANEMGDLVNTVAPVQEIRNMVNHAGDLMNCVAPVQELRNMVTQAANVAPVQELRNMVSHAAKVAPVQELRNMVSHAANEMSEFHPVQEIRNFMMETGKHLEKAEESAKATATQMYEKLIPSGSSMDKRLIAMSHATYTQLLDAWSSVRNIRERLEMAHFLSRKRQRLRQQLKGYRIMLNHMRQMAAAVPSKQMAHMMRRITECNERMETLEGKARAAFVSSTGFTLKNIPGFSRQEPHRYAKFSSDPLLGVATYPLAFHLFILGCSEIPLRIIMKKQGFERCSIGTINYYYHPGRDDMSNKNDESEDDDLRSNSSLNSGGTDIYDDDRMLPLVFVHGIGLGLLPYMPLIECMLQSGRPIFLPEIPYVSGFRPWQNPNSVLQPAVVTSTMTAMLATQGYLRATWLGHSYGTSWLSYMCQFAPSTVAALVFLDPICFGLHIPFLAKQFVYSRPDPGRISYIVRTDVIVNWTIQRSFPWAWIEMFLEHIGDRPCQIYLSENDSLIPTKRIQHYLEENSVPVEYYCSRWNKLLPRKNSISNEYPNSTVDKYKNDHHDSTSSLNPNEMDDNSSFTTNDDVTVSNRFSSAENNDQTTLRRKTTPLQLSSKQELNHSTKAGFCTSKNRNNIRCIVFQNDGHGDWTERGTSTLSSIASIAVELCHQAEQGDQHQRERTSVSFF